MVSELTVIIKDEEKNLKKKFLLYEPFEVNENDAIIKYCIKETLENFGAEPSHISIRINMEIC